MVSFTKQSLWLSLLAVVVPFSLASPFSTIPWDKHAPSLPLPSKTIFQFDDNGTWIENIAVRSNGDLLITMMIPAPLLYRIASPWSPNPKAELICNLTSYGVTSFLGISETQPDTFVLVAGNFSTSGTGGGSYSIWEVAFGKHDALAAPAVRKVTDIPSAVFLNGMTTVSGKGRESGSVVLISDSTLGLIYRVDTLKGTSEVVLQTPEMAVLANETVLIGVNGVKVLDGYLYFDNSFKATVYRIKITPDGFPAAKAQVETVASLEGVEPFLDDFEFSADGKSIWAASNFGNTVRRVDLQKQTSVVVDGSPNQLTVAGDTAVAFGRTANDNKVLYVVTCGAYGIPVNGTIIEPGKVVAIDTTGY